MPTVSNFKFIELIIYVYIIKKLIKLFLTIWYIVFLFLEFPN